VRVEQIALSSGDGRELLHVPGSGPSPAASLIGASLPAGAATHDVPTRALDGYLAEVGPPRPVRLVKCDVEGLELEVFRGAARTLSDDRPDLLFECEARHLRGHGMEDVFGFLAGLGYQGSFFRRGKRMDLGAFDGSSDQAQGRRPYVNNFVFVHPRRRS
jgi:hypothetical protein